MDDIETPSTVHSRTKEWNELVSALRKAPPTLCTLEQAVRTRKKLEMACCQRAQSANEGSCFQKLCRKMFNQLPKEQPQIVDKLEEKINELEVKIENLEKLTKRRGKMILKEESIMTEEKIGDSSHNVESYLVAFEAEVQKFKNMVSEKENKSKDCVIHGRSKSIKGSSSRKRGIEEDSKDLVFSTDITKRSASSTDIQRGKNAVTGMKVARWDLQSIKPRAVHFANADSTNFSSQKAPEIDDSTTVRSSTQIANNDAPFAFYENFLKIRQLNDNTLNMFASKTANSQKALSDTLRMDAYAQTDISMELFENKNNNCSTKKDALIQTNRTVRRPRSVKVSVITESSESDDFYNNVQRFRWNKKIVNNFGSIEPQQNGEEQLSEEEVYVLKSYSFPVLETLTYIKNS